jgi:hypothetical protein
MSWLRQSDQDNPSHISQTMSHNTDSDSTCSTFKSHKLPSFSLLELLYSNNSRNPTIETMCIQYKRGWTQCPHVEADLYIITCSSQHLGEPCKYSLTGTPEWDWIGTRVNGKCWLCEMEEYDSKEKNRRRKRALRRVDFEEHARNSVTIRQRWRKPDTYDT